MDTSTRLRRRGLRAALLASVVAAGVAGASATALSARATAGVGAGASTTSTASTSESTTITTQTSLVCSTPWGSLAKAKWLWVTSPITNVRAGRHTCYDRMTVDLRGKAPGWNVRYVSNVYADGSGKLVPLRGGAKLRVIVRAPAYSVNTGRATYTPSNPKELVNVYGFRTFRQIAWAGSFEGQTTIGLGVGARLPFRVFTLYNSSTNTSRLIVDVAHRWY